MLLIPPENLQLPLKIAFVMIVCNIFGMLIWSVRTAHGAGTLINSPSTESGSTLSWNVVYGIQAVLGLWSGGIVGQSDWTRYAKTPNASLFGQGVTCPLTVIVTALCGLIITSATAQIYGQLHTGDMYTTNSSSAYWYTAGFNWRAIISWMMGVWPLLPGFIRRVRGVIDGNGWDHVYDLSYFFGFFVSGIIHWLLHTAFPTRKQTGSSPFVMELHRTRHVNGEYVGSTTSHEDENVVVGKEKV